MTDEEKAALVEFHCSCGCRPCICEWLRLVAKNPPRHRQFANESERLQHELKVNEQ